MTLPTVPRACIMGHPVSQSRSPMLHGHWLAELGIAGEYVRHDVPPDAFAAFFQGFHASGYVGGNVTAPHKQAALLAVARADAAATAIGAVNTIWTEAGELVGGNTDAHGFIANLDDRADGWHRPTHHAVMLGAGGAARAAIFALRQRGVAVTLLNRTIERAEQLAGHFNRFPGPAVSVMPWDAMGAALPHADLLVNTTVLGMTGKQPLLIDLAVLKPSSIVYDIVYAPLETELLQQARAGGHHTVDGLGMLLHQAVPGFAAWFGQTPAVTPSLRRLIENDLRAKAA